VALAREKRVADLFTTLGTYSAGLRATLSDTSQWSDYANSDPINAILTMFDAMLVRPNVGWMGQAVWTKLRMHPKVVAAVLNNSNGLGGAAAAGVIARRAVVDLLELEDIHVGQPFSNTAKKGQAASYGRLWGKHAGFARIDPNVRDARASMPTFSFTAQWGDRIAGTISDPNIGIDGGQKVRVGEHLKELVSFQDAGCFFQNAVL